MFSYWKGMSKKHRVCDTYYFGMIWLMSLSKCAQTSASLCSAWSNNVLSNILVPIFQVQLHSAREALAEAAVEKNWFGLGKRWSLNYLSWAVGLGRWDSPLIWMFVSHRSYHKLAWSYAALLAQLWSRPPPASIYERNPEEAPKLFGPNKFRAFLKKYWDEFRQWCYGLTIPCLWHICVTNLVVCSIAAMKTSMMLTTGISLGKVAFKDCNMSGWAVS